MKLTIEVCNIDDAEKAKKLLDAYATAGVLKTQEYGERDSFSEPISGLILCPYIKKNMLATFGDITIGELAQKTEKDLLAELNCTKYSLNKINRCLVRLGLQLKTGRHGGSNV